MTTFVMRNGRLVDKRNAPPRDTGRVNGVISDTMDMLKHPGTGAMLDSKARFREHTRASGCVEVGTDPAGAREKPRMLVTDAEIAADVKRAIAELRSK